VLEVFEVDRLEVSISIEMRIPLQLRSEKVLSVGLIRWQGMGHPAPCPWSTCFGIDRSTLRVVVMVVVVTSEIQLVRKIGRIFPWNFEMGIRGWSDLFLVVRCTVQHRKFERTHKPL